MTRPSHRIHTALAIVVAAFVAATPAAAAAPTSMRATTVTGSAVTFKLRALAPRAVRSAYVRSGSRRTRVPVTKVRRALKTRSRKLRVRVPRTRTPQVRTPRSRGTRPVLVVDVVRRAPGTAPAAGAEAPVATAPEAPTVTSPATPDLPLSTGGSPTRPFGSAILDDAVAAAKVVRAVFEPRAVNAATNSRVPTASELSAFRAANTGLHFENEITGDFTGTTDEILQWASWKWGIDAEVLRAVATTESWWRMSEVGDNGLSFGLMQIKKTVHHGTWPLSTQSTAFNVDYYGAVIRQYYDGHATWVMDVEHGKPYTKGDLWGAVGAHFAGRWWTPGAEQYVAKVKNHVAARTWLGTHF